MRIRSKNVLKGQNFHNRRRAIALPAAKNDNNRLPPHPQPLSNRRGENPVFQTVRACALLIATKRGSPANSCVYGFPADAAL
ncbi:MAG: hypothetical protein LBH32_03405 [Dysgonamonadaceae bacterium]|nr:hypothetical protein [Dysgonamonadaceae bacterium]